MSEMTHDQQREDYEQEAATAAADFFYRCYHHVHHGIFDLEDKYILFDSRGNLDFTLIASDLTALGRRHALGMAQGNSQAWAIVVYNYDRTLPRNAVDKLLDKLVGE